MSSGSSVADLELIAKRLAKAVSGYSTEEDLRVGMEHLLRELLPELAIAKYEKSLKTSTFKGRADAVHNALVVEYEHPRTMTAVKVRAKAVEQVCDYLTGLTLGPTAKHQKPGEGSDESGVVYSREEEEKLASGVGVATDGHVFVFVQRRALRWHTDDRTLDADTVEKLLVWLRAMNRKDLSPENLIDDFGHENPLASEIVGALAKLVASGMNPKANVVFAEWRRIFGIVYGTEQLQRSGKSKETKSISSAYNLEIGLGFPVMLFAVHTYYALLMKLLATELIVAQGSIGDTFIGSLARNELRNQLAELESGEVLRRYNIRNAIDQDFFGWYTDAWTDGLGEVLWTFAQRLGQYDIGTFHVKPDRARDLLKDLYHGLIPESIRHALGEYYTPDWLAEHTLELSGYDGDPEKTLLDASSGSGTFLVMAILRARQWLSDRVVEWGTNEKKLKAVHLICKNIVGFDLNPLAVIASRTNYLFALGPLLRFRGSSADFEIPIYQTDAVLLPSQSAQQGLFSQNTISFPMTVGVFELPTEAVENHHVPALMNLLHEAISQAHLAESFVARAIKDLGLSDTKPMRMALENLFGQMADLDSQGKNRIWAKLIRNRYAAMLFRRHFDFVVGNPPHVGWESLTPEWRKTAAGLYKDYGLFSLKGLESQHGGGKKDIAALFTYAVMDHFLKDGGAMSLIVHTSLFKTSGAGEGYRRFRLGNREHFSIESAEDYASFQPFMTHPKMKIKTRTLIFRAIKGKPTKYPVPYIVWQKTKKGIIPGSFTWVDAEKRLASTTLDARPLRGTSKEGRLTPWLTTSAKQYARSKKCIAPIGYTPYYRGREGANTGGLNGAYFVEILERYPDGTVLIRNFHDSGKIKCPKVKLPIEADLLYPVLRGRAVGRWTNTPDGYILMVQDPATQKGYAEAWMQQTHPLTWAYLKKFEKLLRKRKAYIKFFDTEKDAFYSMYAVSQNNFHPHKVIWMDISSTMKASVVSGKLGNDMPMPEKTTMFLNTSIEDEAYYVAAVLNSEQISSVIAGYIVDNHVSTHPIENIIINKFDEHDLNHSELALRSREAHIAAAVSDVVALKAAESAINKAIDKIYK